MTATEVEPPRTDGESEDGGGPPEPVPAEAVGSNEADWAEQSHFAEFDAAIRNALAASKQERAPADAASDEGGGASESG